MINNSSNKNVSIENKNSNWICMLALYKSFYWVKDIMKVICNGSVLMGRHDFGLGEN